MIAIPNVCESGGLVRCATARKSVPGLAVCFSLWATCCPATAAIIFTMPPEPIHAGIFPDEPPAQIDLDGDGKQEVIITYTRENRCDASIVETIMLVNNGPQTGKIEGCSQLFLGPPAAILNDFLQENG